MVCGQADLGADHLLDVQVIFKKYYTETKINYRPLIVYFLDCPVCIFCVWRDTSALFAVTFTGPSFNLFGP